MDNLKNLRKEAVKNKNSGITLIALVVTIIVLLILAGISIQMLTGDNGILTRAGEAKERTEKASIIEQARLDILSKISDNNGEDITEEQFKEILKKYFKEKNIPESFPEDLSSLQLYTLNEGYIINASEIYNGTLKSLVAGLYDSDKKLIYNWQQLIEKNYITISNNQIIKAKQDMESILIVDATITGLSQNALSNCSKLIEIKLPESVTTIEGSGFSGCSSLKTLKIDGKINNIQNGAFSNTNSLTDIYYESEGDWDDIGINYNMGNISLKNATKHYEKETSKEVWARIYNVDGNKTLVLDRDKDFIFNDGTLIKTYEEENQSYMKNHRSSISHNGNGNYADFSIYYNYPVWYGDGDSFGKVIINHSIYPDNTSAWFYHNYIFEYNNMKKLRTKYSTDMSLMFCNAFYNWDDKGNKINQINLDLSEFDTSNVTNMAGMFCQIESDFSNLLTNFNLSSFNTEKVTNMDCMFSYFSGNTAFESGIEALDLSSFNTSNVTSMKNMFLGCGYGSMKSLNLGKNFDTSKVTDMSYMFQYCGRQKLNWLDLGDKFVINISDSNKMKDMFNDLGIESMAMIDLSSISLSALPSDAVLFNCFGKKDCVIFVKDSASKTWMESKNTGYWTDNNRIVVGKNG